MERELEERLERALAALPDAGPGARDRALRAAVAALPEPARPAGSRRRLTALVAAALLALAAAGGALAAIGRLEVRLGSAPEQPPAVAAAPGQPLIPRGADGFVTLAGGRLWLATRSGLGIQGLAATSAALSPHALFVAVGIGSSLVAMSPDGRRAWTHRTPGIVVAAAWAPNPILIAYVVRIGPRYQLRLIEGDGDRDLLLDPDVAPAAPSWRSDSLAIAYVGRAGRPMIHDRFAARRTAVDACRRSGPVRAVAFAPGNGAGVPGESRLALLAARGAFVAGAAAGSGACLRLGAAHDVTGMAWLSSSDLVIADARAGAGALRRYRVAGARARALGVATVAAPPRALAAAPDGSRIALLAASPPGRLEVWLADPPPADAATAPLRLRAVLLRAPAGRTAAEGGPPAAPASLGWR